MFIIHRDGHHSCYTCISNAALHDKRLSLAARGFFAVVLSLPDDWDFSVNGMAKFVGANKETVLRYLRELAEHGYVSITESRDKVGRYARKSYTFYESTVTVNTVTVSTVTDDAAADNAVTEKPAQSNNNISNTEYKQNTVSTDQEEEEKYSFLESQINADKLRAEYGTDYINKVVQVITDCMKAKSRTISGSTVDNTELVRVFGEVREEDIRTAVQAVKGKQFGSFGGYFGSVLFNGIRDRLDKPQIQPQPQATPQDTASSIDVDEVMRDVLAKYLS